MCRSTPLLPSYRIGSYRIFKLNFGCSDGWLLLVRKKEKDILLWRPPRVHYRFRPWMCDDTDGGGAHDSTRRQWEGLHRVHATPTISLDETRLHSKTVRTNWTPRCIQYVSFFWVIDWSDWLIVVVFFNILRGLPRRKAWSRKILKTGLLDCFITEVAQQYMRLSNPRP